MDMKYSALIIDVIESRKYKDRLYVQELLKETIAYLNQKYKETLVKEVVFSGGDEVQGLFKSSVSAYLYLRKLQMLLDPIKIRAGIGRGSINYLPDDWISTEIDGEAYHNARKAISSIPIKDKSFICYNSEKDTDKILNMYLLFNGEIKNKQSNMVKLIELLIDMMYPITEYTYAFFDDDDYAFYHKLFIEKNELYHMSIDTNFTRIDSEACFYLNQEPSLYVDYFWKKGFSTRIATILNTTRQNIDKHITIGRIKESRNMDGTILLMLKMEEKDDY